MCTNRENCCCFKLDKQGTKHNFYVKFPKRNLGGAAISVEFKVDEGFVPVKVGGECGQNTNLSLKEMA